MAIIEKKIRGGAVVQWDTVLGGPVETPAPDNPNASEADQKAAQAVHNAAVKVAEAATVKQAKAAKAEAHSTPVSE